MYFGRVTPEQKRELVIALQNLGHTVAMTGDGVNDILAAEAVGLFYFRCFWFCCS